MEETGVRFCDVCDNLMQLKIGESRQLVMMCRHCGSRGSASRGKRSVLVSEVDHAGVASQWRQYATPALKADPTLPRARFIPCPNESCPSRRRRGRRGRSDQEELKKDDGDGDGAGAGDGDDEKEDDDDEEEGEDTFPEVIYIKYDPVHLKYFYMCTECETNWTR